MPSLLPLPVSRPSPARFSFASGDDQQQLSLRWDSPSRKPTAAKRAAVAAEPLVAAMPLPATAAEWKQALADVRRDYIASKYRQCSARCLEMLDNVKDSRPVEAVHLIYLRFYAASAIEMHVRSLPPSSPLLSRLLLQARDHYRLASALAVQEDASARRPPARALSPVPGLHSPLGSDLSSSSIASTRMSSPAPSLGSLDPSARSAAAAVTPKPKPKPKKRVAFRDLPAYEPTYEPVIRPDSPTLGFDNWCSRQPTPEPVIAAPCLITRSSATKRPPMPSPIVTAPASQHPDPLDRFLHARSVHHYCTLLNSLQRQISSHLAWLDRDIAAAVGSQRLTNEMRALELRTRIERLRADGWRRQRFDAQRYEAVRERALADMD